MASLHIPHIHVFLCIQLFLFVSLIHTIRVTRNEVARIRKKRTHKVAWQTSLPHKTIVKKKTPAYILLRISDGRRVLPSRTDGRHERKFRDVAIILNQRYRDEIRYKESQHRLMQELNG